MTASSPGCAPAMGPSQHQTWVLLSRSHGHEHFAPTLPFSVTGFKVIKPKPNSPRLISFPCPGDKDPAQMQVFAPRNSELLADSRCKHLNGSSFGIATVGHVRVTQVPLETLPMLYICKRELQKPDGKQDSATEPQGRCQPGQAPCSSPALIPGKQRSHQTQLGKNTPCQMGLMF